MSFKREGNDTNLLNKLRKRRISELFSEDIPEDEAKLLCNGRFTCTVCPSNPIFDTVTMLSVHRKGKKHLSSMGIHEAKKRELNQLIAARKHQQYMKDGTTSIKMAASNDRGLLTSCPYDSRVKKVKIKHGERKPILDLSSKDRIMFSAVARKVKNATSSSSVLREAFEQSLSGPLIHHHQLKNVFKEKIEAAPVRVIPYKSKFRMFQTTAKQNIQSFSHTTGVHSQTGRKNHILKHDLGTRFMYGSCKDILPSSSVKAPSCNTLNPEFTAHAIVPIQKSSLQLGSCYSKLSVIEPCTFSLSAGVSPPPPPPSFASTESCTSPVSNLQSIPNKLIASLESDQVKEQSQMSQKLRQLQGSGWKRDWDGKWIKDENAEFDSDEEPPDIP